VTQKEFQMAQARFVHNGRAVDYTPGSAVAAGAVIIQGPLVGIATRAIASGELGALETEGVFDIVKATGAISAGALVYWDADGDPVSGTAGSGALTTTSSGNTLAGKAVAAAVSGDATVRVKIG
jgi:predicted RecA/RadA family phage recombinase